jgi:protein-disulfide isomerase
MDFRRFRHYITTFNPLAGDFSVALKPLRLIPMTLACAAVLSVSTPVLAQQASVSDEERAKIETVIQEYLMSNPGIIINALEKHQNNRQAEQDKQFQSVFKTNKDALYASNAPSFGPKDADVTIVEFYDYNCGYCKRPLPMLPSCATKTRMFASFSWKCRS